MQRLIFAVARRRLATGNVREKVCMHENIEGIIFWIDAAHALIRQLVRRLLPNETKRLEEVVQNASPTNTKKYVDFCIS